MNRKYSIVTVTFQNAEGLTRTLQSIRGLNYKEFELIVMDGGSTDATKDVFERNMDIITIAVSEKDKGIYDAMNRSLTYISGDYVVFMNAGDVFAGSDTLDIVNGYDGDIILGNATYGGVMREVKPMMTFYDIMSIGINHQSAYYKAEVIKSAGFDFAYPIIADLKSIVLPMVKDGAKLSFVTQVLSVCEGGGMSKKRWREILVEKQKLVEEIMDPFYSQDYQKMIKLNNSILPELTVLSQFTSLFPLIRLLSRFALWYNRHFKHIPL